MLMPISKDENSHFVAKELDVIPISYEADQRKITGSEILKIFVGYFLPTSRVIMAGTAEY